MLDIEITSDCNLSCRWCFVRRMRGPQHMPIHVALDILREARPLLGGDLHLTGGEPLIYPHLDELLDSAEALEYERLILNTNGMFLDEQRCRTLASRRLHTTLFVSLDGPRTPHEANRGPGSFRPALEGILTALDQGLSVNVLTVVTKSLLPHLERFVIDLFTVAQGLGGVTFIPVGDVSQGTSEMSRPLDESQLIELVQLSSAFLLSGANVRILDYPLANLVYRAIGLPTTLVGSHCSACRSRLSIQSDGTITPCHPVWLPLGHYEPGVLGRVLDAPVCRSIAHREYEGCRHCPDKHICGHCRAVVLASGRHIFGNDWSCKTLRRLLADRPDLPEATSAAARRIETGPPSHEQALDRLFQPLPLGPTQRPEIQWNTSSQQEVPGDLAHR